MAPADSVSAFPQPGTTETKYAGFWWRVLAALVDGLVIIAVTFVFYIIVIAVFMVIHKTAGTDDQVTSPVQDFIHTYQPLFFVINIVFNWLYYAFQESSNGRATLGKKACGLVVTEMEGRRISFLRATGRFFAKYVSALPLGVGYMMVGWTKRKQGLHDMIASTLVIKWN